MQCCSTQDWDRFQEHFLKVWVLELTTFLIGLVSRRTLGFIWRPAKATTEVVSLDYLCIVWFICSHHYCDCSKLKNSTHEIHLCNALWLFYEDMYHGSLTHTHTYTVYMSIKRWIKRNLQLFSVGVLMEMCIFEIYFRSAYGLHFQHFIVSVFMQCGTPARSHEKA